MAIRYSVSYSIRLRFPMEDHGRLRWCEITSDTGRLPVREFDERLGLTARLDDAVRTAGYVTHGGMTLLRPRSLRGCRGLRRRQRRRLPPDQATVQTLAHRHGASPAADTLRLEDGGRHDEQALDDR